MKNKKIYCIICFILHNYKLQDQANGKIPDDDQQEEDKENEETKDLKKDVQLEPKNRKLQKYAVNWCK